MWFQDMAKSGIYVDHMFLEMAAEVLERDIVVIPLHSQNNGDLFHVISAGLLTGGGRGENVPIFLGKLPKFYFGILYFSEHEIVDVNQGLSISTAIYLSTIAGYFEDNLHTAGHFQSVTPVRDSDILRDFKMHGGVDVAEMLRLPRESGV